MRVRSRAETTETALSDSISRIGPAFCKVPRRPSGKFNQFFFSHAPFVTAGLNSTAWNDPLPVLFFLSHDAMTPVLKIILIPSPVLTGGSVDLASSYDETSRVSHL